MTDALALIPGEKKLLLDVGANIGTVGIFAVAKGYFERCIAFEPEPNNFHLLKCNVFLNKLDEKFELKNEALSSEKHSSLNFELSEFNHGDHRVRVQEDSGLFNEADRKVIQVACSTLDSALIGYELDGCVLFMDTQGFEGHVLGGAKKLLQKGLPIITEFAPYYLKRAGGLDLFYQALSISEYTTMWNLEEPEAKLKFSLEELNKILYKLPKGKHTSLLIIDERKH